jgi:hypothetical protein
MPPEARERSFDELARGLANGSISRGRALKLMGAALVGGALASLGGVAAADEDDQGENEDCKRNGKKCKRNNQCCSGICSSLTGRCEACSTTNCPGCCDSNGRCQPGTTNEACGIHGGVCQTCVAPRTCQQVIDTRGENFFCIAD